MAVELLVLAKSKGRHRRGAVIAVKDSPAVWGKREGPPNFVIVKIADMTRAEFEATSMWRPRKDRIGIDGAPEASQIRDEIFKPGAVDDALASALELRARELAPRKEKA